jgi:plasmid stabilization system protein ParE
MSGYNLHPEAFEDLDEIWEFIAENNLGAADKMIEHIYDAIHSLIKMPRQGHRRSDLTSRPLRFWPVRDYLIAYAPDEHPLVVIAVIHGRRNPSVISAILKGRE